MARIIVLLLLVMQSVSSTAQTRTITPPNFEEIKSKSTDPQSVYYFPKLLERYQNNDTTLQDDEYKYLYFGAFYNKENDDDASESVTKELEKILKKDSLSTYQKKRAILLAKTVLEHEPFNLKKINLTYELYRSLNDSINARPYFKKMIGLLRTIVATGDGKSKQTGFYVREVSDEYMIVSVLGYKSAGQSLLHDPPTDQIHLVKNEDNLEYLYFNVTQIFAGYDEMFKDVKLTLPNDDGKKKKRR